MNHDRYLSRVDYEYDRYRDEAVLSGMSTSAFLRNMQVPERPQLDPQEQQWIDEEIQRERDQADRALERIMGRAI